MPFIIYNRTFFKILCSTIILNYNYHSYSQDSDTIFKNYKKIEIHKIDSVINLNKQNNRLIIFVF